MRPSWQTDVKWIAGLVACLLVLASGVLFSLARITERDTAVPATTAIVAFGISERVSDEEYAAVQAAAAANPEAPVSLGPLSVTARGSEIAGLTKDQAANLMAGKVAAVLYNDGADAAKALVVEPPPGSDKSALSFGPAGALSSDNHSKFSQYFLFSAILMLLLLAVVVFMSRGFGRLGSPALVLAVGSAPLALLWTVAGSAAGSGDADENVFLHSARQALTGAADDLSSTFAMLAVAAFVAAALALISGIATPLVRRLLESRTHTETGAELQAGIEVAETPVVTLPGTSIAPS
jgi:hypothetical protein